VAEFLIANMAPIMFSALVVFLLLGYPVAFSLAAVGMAFGLLGIQLGLLTPNLLQAFPDRVFGIMKNEILLAIPFFTFMGLILERSGMAEALLDTIGQLFGGLRGGLAYAVILVGGLLAATTGVVAASVIAMGLISLPIMLRYGYDKSLASGVIAASGTLAQIIPPSLVLIVLADVLGRSVGDMYKGAFIPGFMLMGLYLLWVFLNTIFRPQGVPALPPEARTLRGAALFRRVLVAMVPPLLLIFLVLGSIFIGWATPTEGGALGAVGALGLALVKGKLNRTMLVEFAEDMRQQRERFGTAQEQQVTQAKTDLEVAKQGIEALKLVKQAKLEGKKAEDEHDMAMEAQRLQLRGSASMQALVATLDGEKADRILKLAELEMRKGLSVEQAMALVAEKSPEIAPAIAAAMRAKYAKGQEDAAPKEN